jgi:hypothetical protein
MPARISISGAELDVVESYLGAEIDTLFDADTKAATDLCRRHRIA